MEIAVLAKPLVIWSPTDVLNVLHGCQNLNESFKRAGIEDQQVGQMHLCVCVCEVELCVETQ